MVQSSHVSPVSHSKWLHSVRCVGLNKLRQHEEVNLIHLRELKEEIRSDGMLKLAIVVDIDTNIIIDGEHRFNALKALGCRKIPVVFVDYDSPEIEVQAWRKGEQLTKKDVIEAGFNRQKLPPTTTKHMVKIFARLRHISTIEERVNIPLEKLRGDIDECG